MKQFLKGLFVICMLTSFVSYGQGPYSYSCLRNKKHKIEVELSVVRYDDTWNSFGYRIQYNQEKYTLVSPIDQPMFLGSDSIKSIDSKVYSSHVVGKSVNLGREIFINSQVHRFDKTLIFEYRTFLGVKRLLFLKISFDNRLLLTNAKFSDGKTVYCFKIK
jgi:hypothetical protein